MKIGDNSSKKILEALSKSKLLPSRHTKAEKKLIKLLNNWHKNSAKRNFFIGEKR